MPMTGEQEEKLDDLLLAIDGEHGVNARLKDLKDSARTRTIVLVAAITVALVVAVGGVGVAFSARHDAHRAETALAQSQANTEVARRSSCVKSNDDRRNLIDRLSSVFSVSNADFVDALISLDGPPSPAARAAADAFNLNHDLVVHKKLAEALERRDCTKRGIQIYLGLTARQ